MSTNNLPDEKDPIVLADGTEIDPETGRPIPKEFIPVPTNSEAVEAVHRTRLHLSDIPVPPEQMNTVSAILAYTVMGLSDQEIALVVKTSEGQVTKIRTSDIYEELKQHLIDGMVEQDGDNVRALFAHHSKTAATNIINLSQDNTSPASLRFNASRDVLDRAGHRPVDVHEHRVRTENTLKIVHIKREEKNDIPTIEMEVDENGNCA